MSLLAAVAALACAAAAEPAHLGVSDFKATPELASLSGALSGIVANELTRMGAFKVTSARQVSDLLSLERQKQLLGCENDDCVAAVSVDLGFDYLVTGTLTRYAGGGAKAAAFTLELMLLQPKTGTRTGSEVVTGKDEAELMGNVSPAVAKLVGKLLKERSGSLVVLSSEAAAVLKVDDVAVGTTPLAGKLQVAGGPHYLRLEKDGFVAWQKEVRIAPDAVTEESVRLVPSPDFIAAYESKQQKLRIGAWAATGLCVAGVVAAVAFEARAASQYGAKDVTGSFVALRERVAAGDEDARAAMNQAKAEVATSQTLSAVFIGVAAAGAAGATVLWLLGDDPNRYGAYREVGLSVGPGSVGVSGRW